MRWRASDAGHSRASDAVRWRSSDAGHWRASDAASDEVRWRASDALHPRVSGASEAPLLTELFGKPQIQPLTISASKTDPIPCLLLAISATETFSSPRELCSVHVVDTASANRVSECVSSIITKGILIGSFSGGDSYRLFVIIALEKEGGGGWGLP